MVFEDWHILMQLWTLSKMLPKINMFSSEFPLQNDRFFIKKSIKKLMSIIVWSESHFGITWGAFLHHLGAIWEHLGTTWAPSWRQIPLKLAHLGPSLLQIGPNQPQPGTRSPQTEPNVTQLGPNLAPSANFGAPKCHLGSLRHQFWDPLGPVLMICSPILDLCGNSLGVPKNSKFSKPSMRSKPSNLQNVKPPSLQASNRLGGNREAKTIRRALVAHGRVRPNLTKWPWL